MKKKAVFTLVACSIAALLLTGVLAVGLSQNGFGIGALLEEAERGYSSEDGGTRYEYTWDPAETETTGLDVEWINGTVDVTVGSGDVIRIIEKSGKELKSNEKLELSRSGGVLKIKWNHELISFSIFQNRRKDLTVEVPKALAESMEALKCSNTSGKITVSGFTAEELEFSSTSGDLELSGLSGTEADISTTSGKISLDGMKLSEDLDVSSTSGALVLSNVQAKETDLSTTSGSVSYAGSADELKASTVSASVRAELYNCPKKAEMSSVSGGLTLAIPENKGFEAEYNSVSGSFESDFAVTGASGAKSGHALYSGGESSFSFSTTSGDMRILKR